MSDTEYYLLGSKRHEARDMLYGYMQTFNAVGNFQLYIKYDYVCNIAYY